jgi:hypothetical protein
MSFPLFLYETINRNAIIVRPQKPYFEWVNSLNDEYSMVDERDENNIYLIREMNSNEEILRWVKRNFDKLFVNELNDWCTDEGLWPKKRTFAMFSKWFQVEVASMILDLEDFEVTKD